MNRKRLPADVQPEDDYVVSMKRALHQKLFKTEPMSPDTSPERLDFLNESPTLKQWKPHALQRSVTKQRPFGATRIDRMKKSDASTYKIPLSLSSHLQSSNIVTINSDDEDQKGNLNSKYTTGNEKVIQLEYNRHHTDVGNSSRQHLPSSASPYPSIYDDKPMPQKKKTRISLSTRKHHNNNKAPIRNSTAPTSSLSTPSIGSPLPLSPPKLNTRRSITFPDDISNSDDDDYQSSPPQASTNELYTKCESFLAPPRESSPLQHPDHPSVEMNIDAIPTEMEQFYITSPPKPPSNNDDTTAYLKSSSNDKYSDLFIWYDQLDEEFKAETKQRNRRTDDVESTINTETKQRNRRTDGMELTTNSENRDTDWDNDNGLGRCNIILKTKGKNQPSSSSPSRSKVNNDDYDSATLFIPRRSTRQRTKPILNYDERTESDTSGMDHSSTRSLSLATSRKNKSIESTRETSTAPVELSDEEMDEQNHTVLFTYPVDRSKGSITITAQDQSRLEPSQYLNDSVIDFYLKWLMDLYSGTNGHKLPSQKERQTAKDTHIFSTHFYNRLTQGHGKSISYENVRKWTSGIDLFSKKHVIFPINENWHWYLVLVYNLDLCIPGRPGMDSDSETDDEDIDRPYIFVLDSLGGRQRKCVRDLVDYLSMEAVSRRGIGPSKFILPRPQPAKVPRQDNTCDCGVFLLHFVDQFMNSPQTFVRTLLAHDTQHEIWKEDQIKEKRSELKSVFEQVQRQYEMANN